MKAGDTVGLVIPSSAQWDPTSVEVLLESLTALGLTGKLGKHVFDRRGYFAGRDEDRASDLNAMFADPEVDAIHCIRGGWGAARLLPLLDWATIAKSPKILVGYSDITALLLALHAKTGLVTFHGPNGSSVWNTFNLDWMKRVLWNGEAAAFANLKETDDSLVPVKNRTRTIIPGKARGRLLGGNLTVFTTIIGSGYLPDFKDSILFVEDVEEAPYSLDRMFTQLKLAGILGQVKGVVWGTCYPKNDKINEYHLFHGLEAVMPYTHTHVHGKYWDRWKTPEKDWNDVARSVRILNAHRFKSTIALEYEHGPVDGIEGSKLLMKEVLAAL